MSPKDMTVSKKAAAKNGLVFVLFEQSTTVKYRGYLISNWGLLITTWGYFNQLGYFLLVLYYNINCTIKENSKLSSTFFIQLGGAGLVTNSAIKI